MKEVNKIEDASLYLKARDILKIANDAVAKAKAENKRLGLPECFWKNGRIYYLLPNGELTTEVPEILKTKDPL
ncbi:MAG: hypothetical protein AAGG75_19745 [Bacteroidota bacterium]